MANCMEKCCDSRDCDLAYMVEKKCYSVSCSSKDECRPVSVKASKKTPLISAMVMKKAEPKEETGNAYSVMIIICHILLPAISQITWPGSCCCALNLIASTRVSMLHGVRGTAPPGYCCCTINLIASTRLSYVTW